MDENPFYWILGAEVIGAAIILFGFFLSKDLPKKQKKIRIQKFAAIALALMAFSINVFKPYTSSYSYAEHADELEVKNLNSIEDFAKFQQKQTGQIERLKNDIKELREDLYSVNRYYGNVNQLLSSGIITFCLIFAFNKRKEDEEIEDNPSNQVSKL